MKDFLKSKKGIVTIVALVIVIAALVFAVVKCSNGSSETKKGKDEAKTEQENKENEGVDWNDVGLEPEDTSDAGLTSVGGEVGAKHPEDVTEFPNDEESDNTTNSEEPDNTTNVDGDGQSGEDASKDDNTEDTTEKWQGGTLY